MFFDLNKLQEQSRNAPNVMLKMLQNFYEKKLPKNNQMIKYFSKVSLHGDSFILYPERLFSAQVDVNYKVQYIILAAKRDYLFYKLYGVEYLDLSFFPDLNLDKIKHNPLMRIEDNKLIFNL